MSTSKKSLEKKRSSRVPYHTKKKKNVCKTWIIQVLPFLYQIYVEYMQLNIYNFPGWLAQKKSSPCLKYSEGKVGRRMEVVKRQSPNAGFHIWWWRICMVFDCKGKSINNLNREMLKSDLSTYIIMLRTDWRVISLGQK